MPIQLKLKKRIHLVKRLMSGENVREMCEDLSVTHHTLNNLVSEVMVLNRIVGRSAGIPTLEFYMSPGTIHRYAKQLAPSVNHFEGQAVVFEKNPTPDHLLLYLDMGSRAYRSLSTAALQMDETYHYRKKEITIRQVMQLFHDHGVNFKSGGLGHASKLEFFEAIARSGLDRLWDKTMLTSIDVFIAKHNGIK